MRKPSTFVGAAGACTSRSTVNWDRCSVRSRKVVESAVKPSSQPAGSVVPGMRRKPRQPPASNVAGTRPAPDVRSSSSIGLSKWCTAWPLSAQ